MSRNFSEGLSDLLLGSLLNRIAAGSSSICGQCDTRVYTDIYVGLASVVRFREQFCSEEKRLQLVIQADSDGNFYIVIRFLKDEDVQEAELRCLCAGASLLEVARTVRCAGVLPELSQRNLSAVIGTLDNSSGAIECLRQQGVDVESLPTLQGFESEISNMISRCRESGITLDTSEVTDAVRDGLLALSNERLRRLGVETLEDRDIRLDREGTLTRRISKTFRKFARFIRPESENQIVDGLTTLALELDRTGRIDDQQELVATCLYLTSIGVSSVAELNDMPSALVVQAIEHGGRSLQNVKEFLNRRYDSFDLCERVEDRLRWWDVTETENDSVEDLESAFAGTET